MKLECCFCKSKDPEMIPFKYGTDVFCSASCLNAHMAMSEIKQRTGFYACIYYKIMVISRCAHRLIKSGLPLYLSMVGR